jgi:ATP phosphoribosyltransferase
LLIQKDLHFILSAVVMGKDTQNLQNAPLRIALQKSGRLGEESLDLLKKSGFKIHASGRNLIAKATNFPLEVLFLRVGDIPEIVSDGLADLGIVGENSLAEKEDEYDNLEIIEQLGFSHCRLCLAVPESSPIKTLEDFSGKTIAATYSNIVKNFFSQKKIDIKVVKLSGSVEIAPQLGLADAICDIVSTGATLKAHHLENIAEIFTSQAVLFTRKGHQKVLQQKGIEDFLMRMHSVLTAKDLKSVVMNAPENALEKIEKILPALESPTIMPLAKEGWVAFHAVMKEDDFFWEKIKKLKAAGATGILISPLGRVIE